MKFGELWEEVQRLKMLPEVAIINIPSMLSEVTKETLKKMEPYDVCVIIRKAIDEVNAGAVEPLNSIILKLLSDSK